MKSRKKSLFSVSKYIEVFIVSFFVCACNLILYETYERTVKEEDYILLWIILNILFLSLLVTLLDSIRRKITIEAPVKSILKGMENISEGNFHSPISPLHTKRINEFDDIIDGINQMAKELSEVETLKTDFVSNVSHEIKTPLAIIQNYATMLQSKNLSSKEQEEYAKTIADAARRLSHLVVNILKLNKLENQEIYPKQEVYNVGEQLRCTLLKFEDVWSQKDLDICAEIEDAEILCDRDLMEIVWSNLISNAIKFTEPKGKVTVVLKKETDSVIVSVSDTGCGMDETTGKHIFDKFYQGDTSHAKEGNGLGLAMVKRVIDIVKADISLESKLGIGTTFTVKIKKGNVNQ